MLFFSIVLETMVSLAYSENYNSTENKGNKVLQILWNNWKTFNHNQSKTDRKLVPNKPKSYHRLIRFEMHADL